MSKPTPVQAAAKRLKTTIRAPAWAVSVAPWMQADREIICVRVDPRYLNRLPQIPQVFEGFAVEIVQRQTPLAYIQTAIRA